MLYSCDGLVVDGRGGEQGYTVYMQKHLQSICIILFHMRHYLISCVISEYLPVLLLTHINNLIYWLLLSWQICYFIITLVTVILNTFMYFLLVLSQIYFLCYFLITLVAAILNTFIYWAPVLSQIDFLCCFLITLVTHIFNTCIIMFCVFSDHLTMLFYNSFVYINT